MKTSCLLLIFLWGFSSLVSAATMNDFLVDDPAVEALFANSLDITSKLSDQTISIRTDTLMNGCDASYTRGYADATSFDWMWFGIGFGGCCVSFGMASYALPFIAMYSNVEPKAIPPGVEAECYKKGFEKNKTKRRVFTTLGGTLAATIAAPIAYFGTIFLLAILTAQGN